MDLSPAIPKTSKDPAPFAFHLSPLLGTWGRGGQKLTETIVNGHRFPHTRETNTKMGKRGFPGDPTGEDLGIHSS